MKLVNSFVVMGIVAIGGCVLYMILKKNRSETAIDRNSDMERDLKDEKIEAREENSLIETVEVFEEKKMDIYNDFIQRHETAAKIIKDSMGNILSENANEITSENIEDLNSIDNDIDKLLD